MSDSGSEIGDKRVLRSKAKVLEVTYDLLSQEGVSGVSVDEVTRRSGVSKATIYRHWPSRSALLIEACRKIGEPVEPPDSGSWSDDAAFLAGDLAHQLRHGSWPSILPSIVDAAERDPEVAELQASLYARFTAPFLLVAERAAELRLLPDGMTATDAVAAIVGPLFFRRWFSKQPIDTAFVEMIVKSVSRADGSPPKPGRI